MECKNHLASFEKWGNETQTKGNGILKVLELVTMVGTQDQNFGITVYS